MMKPGPWIVAALSLFAAPALDAQEAKLDYSYLEDFVVDGEPVWFLRRAEILPFVLDKKEMGLKADRVIVWVKESDKAGGPAPAAGKRFYAEGNVVFYRRDLENRKLEMFRADRFYLDLEKRTGYFSDLRLDQRPGDDARAAVTLRAREARLTAGGGDAAAEKTRVAVLGLPGLGDKPPGRLAVFDVVLSTCTFGQPHYHVGLAEAQVDWTWVAGPGSPLVGFFLGKPDDPGIGGDWVTVSIWGVPVFAWPSFYMKLAAVSALPLEKVQGGHTSRFGNTIETTWGLKVSKGFVDALNPFGVNDSSDDKDSWGRFRWEIDWRQERGWAAGIDPSWKWGDYFGYLDTYYLRDKGPDPDNDFDAQFIPLEREDRGRARFFHRAEVTTHLRAELEVSWLSDRNVLQEFFEQEFKEGKEQETVAYLRYLDGNKGGFLMEKVRINGFQTQLEFLPKAKVYLADEPLLPGLPVDLTFTEELELVNLRQRFDNDLGLDDEQTWRFDSLSSWALSLPLGVATLSPFADARITAWQEALDGDAADRFIATGGARLAMDIHGVHGVQSEFLGLHGLRHIIHLEARGVTAFTNSLEPAELFQYDAVDGLDKFTEYSFEIRQRFQTKFIDGQAFKTKDFLEIGAEIEYYPDKERDSVGFNAANSQYPFNWITLAPHDSTKVLDERGRSNIHWDVVYRPSNFLEARGMGEYNPVHNQEEAREYTVALRPHPGLELSVGQVFVFDVTNAFTVAAKWALTEKWGVTAEAQFDFKTDEYINRKATVSRNFHDFQFEAVFEEDVGRDERRFYITFVPTFLRIPN